jgi:POT family proton-dependent oligopeptide transporter
VRAVLQVYRVFVPLPVFWSLYDQHASRWVFQADDMDRTLFLDVKIEPDQVPTVGPILILILIPIFNKFVYPGLAACRIRLRPLARMGVGMVFISAAFVVAGLIELWMDESYLFVAWQLPQYFLLSCGEVLVSITGLEFAYSQAPESMKSVVMAGWLLTTAIGNIIVAVIAEGEIFGDQAIEFFFFAGLMMVFLVIFMLFVRTYQYVEDSKKEEEGATTTATITTTNEEDALFLSKESTNVVDVTARKHRKKSNSSNRSSIIEAEPIESDLSA